MDQETDDFDSWYRGAYGTVLTAVSFVCGGDHAAAEDATNDAFVAAFEAWREVSRMDSSSRWVTKVAVNNAKRTFRRRKRRIELLNSLNSGRLEIAWTDSHRDVDLWTSLQDLSTRQRAALVLRYVDDLTQADVAKNMGARNRCGDAQPGEGETSLCDRTGDQAMNSQSEAVRDLLESVRPGLIAPDPALVRGEALRRRRVRQTSWRVGALAMVVLVGVGVFVARGPLSSEPVQIVDVVDEPDVAEPEPDLVEPDVVDVEPDVVEPEPDVGDVESEADLSGPTFAPEAELSGRAANRRRHYRPDPDPRCRHDGEGTIVLER